MFNNQERIKMNEVGVKSTHTRMAFTITQGQGITTFIMACTMTMCMGIVFCIKRVS